MKWFSCKRLFLRGPAYQLKKKNISHRWRRNYDRPVTKFII